MGYMKVPLSEDDGTRQQARQKDWRIIDRLKSA
jgi:hypothetical protein